MDIPKLKIADVTIADGDDRLLIIEVSDVPGLRDAVVVEFDDREVLFRMARATRDREGDLVSWDYLPPAGGDDLRNFGYCLRVFND